MLHELEDIIFTKNYFYEICVPLKKKFRGDGGGCTKQYEFLYNQP